MKTRSIKVINNGKTFSVDKHMRCADTITSRGSNTFRTFFLGDKDETFSKNYPSFKYIAKQLKAEFDEKDIMVKGLNSTHTFILFRLFRYYRNDRLEKILDDAKMLMEKNKIKPIPALLIAHYIHYDKFFKLPSDGGSSYASSRDMFYLRNNYFIILPEHNLEKFIKRIEKNDQSRGYYWTIFKALLSTNNSNYNTSCSHIIKCNDVLYKKRYNRIKKYIKNKEYNKLDRCLKRLSKIYS